MSLFLGSRARVQQDRERDEPVELRVIALSVHRQRGRNLGDEIPLPPIRGNEIDVVGHGFCSAIDGTNSHRWARARPAPRQRRP
jgi:hypothetical protein